MIMSVTKRRSFRINKSRNVDCLAAYLFGYGIYQEISNGPILLNDDNG